MVPLMIVIAVILMGITVFFIDLQSSRVEIPDGYEERLFLLRAVSNKNCFVDYDASLDRMYQGVVRQELFTQSRITQCYPGKNHFVSITLKNSEKKDIITISTSTTVAGKERVKILPVLIKSTGGVRNGYLQIKVVSRV